MGQAAEKYPTINQLDISLERDGFCRNIIRELSGLLQDMIGLDEAEGYISIVGQNIGNAINEEYKSKLGVDCFDADQLAGVLVDLKDRIHGDFRVEEQTEEKLVFSNSVCPFGDKVKDRESLCMMTSNVFGTITAANNDFAKVVLNDTIARGCDHCKVTVYLKNTDEAQDEDGREYFKEE